jgi:co-chaperonin GroES (HSP10)
MKQTDTTGQVWSDADMCALERGGIVSLFTEANQEQPISGDDVEVGQSVFMKSFSGNEYNAEFSVDRVWEIHELNIIHRVIKI